VRKTAEGAPSPLHLVQAAGGVQESLVFQGRDRSAFLLTFLSESDSEMCLGIVCDLALCPDVVSVDLNETDIRPM
jgi:hypothetical protein